MTMSFTGCVQSNVGDDYYCYMYSITCKQIESSIGNMNSEVLAVLLFSSGILKKSLNLLDLQIFHLENEDMTVPV